MRLIRRNTPGFRSIRELIDELRKDPSRKRSVLLYALKPGEPLSKKILINTLKQNKDVLYDLQYEVIYDLLRERSHKLFGDDRSPLFYFKTAANSTVIESPFEFRGATKKKIQET
jgi:hypothetical protein